MIPKFRNIVIFITILLVIFVVYVYFFKGSGETPNLVSSSPSGSGLPDIVTTEPNGGATGSATSLVAKDFLTLLLNVKNIKLNDTIFSDEAFLSLHDSTIILVPDGNEGRPNPFAQFGNDELPPPVEAPLPSGPTP